MLPKKNYPQVKTNYQQGKKILSTTSLERYD